MSTDHNATTTKLQLVANRVCTSIKSAINQMIKVKSINEVQEEFDRGDKLRQELHWYELLCLGIGGTIGAGIFVLSGQAAAQHAGPSVILSFIVTGIIALLAAISFSELAVLMPSCGSAYTYVYAALGEYAGFFIGWNFALLYTFSMLTVVVAWSSYVVGFIELTSGLNVTSSFILAPVAWNETGESFFVTGKAINFPAIAISIAITVIVVIGVRQTSVVNVILVVFKVIVLLTFIFACCSHIDKQNYSSFIPQNEGSFGAFGVTGMLQGCTVVFFACVGFETVATAAQEAHAPQKSLPIGLIGSTVISSLIYIIISIIMVGVVPYNKLNQDLGDSLRVVIEVTSHGLWLKIAMKLGGIASLTTVGLVVMFAQSRIIYAMAKDGFLPAMFTETLKRTSTPWLSTLSAGSLCALLAGLVPVDILGEMTSIGALITYIFVHVTVMIVYYKKQNRSDSFRVPFGPYVIPPFGILLCILLLAGTTTSTAIRFLVWTALGQIVYFAYGFWHSKGRIGKALDITTPGSQRRSITLSVVDVNEQSYPSSDIGETESEV